MCMWCVDKKLHSLEKPLGGQSICSKRPSLSDELTQEFEGAPGQWWDEWKRGHVVVGTLYCIGESAGVHMTLPGGRAAGL